MIESIQFREGVLSLTVSLPRNPSSCERERSIEFDFGEGGAVAELHGSELMNFLYSVYTERAYKIRHLIFELLSTEARVCRVNFHLIYRSSESLEGGTATDEQVKFSRGAIQGARCQEDVTFCFSKG